MKLISYFLLLITALSCSNSKYKADDFLSEVEQKDLILKLAPYVERSPGPDFTIEDKLDPKYEEFYRRVTSADSLSFSNYYPTDSVIFFILKRKEVASLFNDYRLIGGYYQLNQQDSIVDLDLLFFTPIMRQDKIEEVREELFSSIVQNGSVETLLGNAELVEWPNQDVVYDKTVHEWIVKENELLKLLKEEKEKYNNP